MRYQIFIAAVFPLVHGNPLLMTKPKGSIIADFKNGLIFELLPSFEETNHAEFKLNFTMLRNNGLKEINCGKKKNEYDVVESAWNRLEKSLK